MKKTNVVDKRGIDPLVRELFEDFSYSCKVIRKGLEIYEIKLLFSEVKKRAIPVEHFKKSYRSILNGRPAIGKVSKR